MAKRNRALDGGDTESVGAIGQDGGGASGDGGAADYTDPVAAGDAAGEPGEPAGEPRRGRGRPRGSGRAAAGSKARPSLDLSIAVGLLAALHVAAAQRYQDDRLALSDAEQAALVAAVNAAARHYSIPVTQKVMDTGAMFVTLFRIEAPRAAILLGKRGQPEPQAQPSVFPFQAAG